MSQSNNCEMCGANAWIPLPDGEWKRCICGHLEIVLSQRSCSECGGSLGRYAKESATVCFACKGGGGYCCKTTFCYNQLDKQSKGGYCQECLTEMELTPDGHKWKELASFIFQSPTQMVLAISQVQVEYPHITKSRLTNWVIKHWRSGRMKKTARGIYQVKEDR